VFVVDHVLESRVALDPIVHMRRGVDITASIIDPIAYIEKPSRIPWRRKVILVDLYDIPILVVRLEIILSEVK
jgi:hypothetical protein